MNTRPSAAYCDDGNTKTGDGCDDGCKLETGWSCSGATSTQKDSCVEICGDGFNYGYYSCDDGNKIDGDG